MIMVMIKICVSSSIDNYKLTPTTFCNVDLADHVILNKQVALKVVTLHKIKDPCVSKNLKREPAIMAKLNHPIIVSLEEVVSVVYYYAWSSTFVPWRRPWQHDWKREDRALRAARGAGASSTVIISSMTTMGSWRRRDVFQLKI